MSDKTVSGSFYSSHEKPIKSIRDLIGEVVEVTWDESALDYKEDYKPEEEASYCDRCLVSVDEGWIGLQDARVADLLELVPASCIRKLTYGNEEIVWRITPQGRAMLKNETPRVTE